MKFCSNCGNDLRNIESVFEKMVKQPINLLKIELVGYRIMEKLQERISDIKIYGCWRCAFISYRAKDLILIGIGTISDRAME